MVRTSREFLKSNSRRVEEVTLETVNEMANLFVEFSGGRRDVGPPRMLCKLACGGW